jgi:hypothetical protein
MDKYGIKTTLYDFFGYFIPGICFYIFFAITEIVNHGYIDTLNYFEILNQYSVKYKYLDKIPVIVLIIIGVIAIYLSGQILSTCSSFLFEKLLIKKIAKIQTMFSTKNLVSENIYNMLKKMIQKKYEFDYEDKDIRLCITSVENKSVNTYNTAFVFLSFYGMQRCLSMISAIFAIIEAVQLFHIFTFPGLCYLFVLIFATGVLFYGYYRFYKYFYSEIICSYCNIEVE